MVHAYETWGFKRLTRELIDALNIWARFIYGPLLDDRVRTIADGVKPSEYGRKEAFRVHQALKKRGPVTVPREFVFMDRAADRPRRGVPASGGGTEFLSIVQRGDRALFGRRGRQAAKRGAGAGGTDALGAGLSPQPLPLRPICANPCGPA